MTRELKHYKKHKLKSNKIISFTNICSIFSVFLLVLLLKNPIIAHRSVSNALRQCVSFLIPSLFPLMIVSEIVTESGAIDKITKYFSTPISKILNVSKKAVSPFFLGLVGGYTTSVSSAISLYNSGKITREDCERILCFSSLPSMAFLTSFVGAGVFQNSTIGCWFWVISVLSALLLSLSEQLITKICPKKRKKHTLSDQNTHHITIDENRSAKNRSMSRIIVSAISHSAQAILMICACVTFFSTLIDILRYPLDALSIDESIKHVLLGSLELTNGISSCADLDNSALKIGSSAFFIGWSGLCVHAQIISLCESTDLSFKKYFIYKLFQGLICSFIALMMI